MRKCRVYKTVQFTIFKLLKVHDEIFTGMRAQARRLRWRTGQMERM